MRFCATIEEAKQVGMIDEIESMCLKVAQYQVQISNQIIEMQTNLKSLSWKQLLQIHLNAITRSGMEYEYGSCGISEWKAAAMSAMNGHVSYWKSHNKQIP